MNSKKKRVAPNRLSWFAYCAVTAAGLGSACTAEERGTTTGAAELALVDGSTLLSVSARGMDANGSAIGLATVAAWRGDVPLSATISRSEVGPDLVVMARTDFVETVQLSAEGAEQSWQFDRAPGSAGDLTIAVDATGLEYVGSDSAGLQLQNHGTLEVRYGHGTWIDASGQRVSIPARYEKGRILLTVPAAVIEHSMFPVVLDPVIIVTPIVP